MNYTVQIETQIERIGRYAIGEDRFREDESFETGSISEEVIDKLKNLGPNQQMIILRLE